MQQSNRSLDSVRQVLKQAYVQWHMNRVPWSPDIQVSTLTGRSGVWGEDNHTGSYNTNIDLIYTPDIWGRQQAIANSSKALWQAAGYDVDATKLILRSEVVSQYLQLLSLRELTDLAGLNLAVARRVLTLTESKYRAGAIAEQDFALQLSLVASLEADLPQLQQRQQLVMTTLSGLLDLTPQELTLQAHDLGQLSIPQVSHGLPSSDLLGRPDVLRAEQQLASAGYDIDAAHAAMFPNIILSASSTIASVKLDSFFHTSPIWSTGLTVDLPIWDQGRRVDQRHLALLNRKIAANNYRQTLLTAFGEVENALHAGLNLQRQQAWVDIQLNAAEVTLRIAQSRYQAGADDLQDIFTAQSALYAARQRKSLLRYERLQAACNLAVALGGRVSIQK